jgi:hypothetical protein
MHSGNLIFAQPIEFAPWHTFRRLVGEVSRRFQRSHLQLSGPISVDGLCTTNPNPTLFQC